MPKSTQQWKLLIYLGDSKICTCPEHPQAQGTAKHQNHVNILNKSWQIGEPYLPQKPHLIIGRVF